MLIAGRDHFFVLDRAARLDDRGNARFRRTVNGVWKRKECIRSQHSALRTVAGLLQSQHQV